MEVKRDIAIGIFEKMGYKIANKWNSKKLARMIHRLPDWIDANIDYKFSDAESEWLDGVLNGITEDKNIVFEIIDGEKSATEEELETTEETKTAESTESTEPPAFTKKKTRMSASSAVKCKKATKKALGKRKETIYDKAVFVVRQQKGEFTVKALVDKIVSTSDLKPSTARLVINMAMAYGVAIGQLEKVKRGTYKPIV